MLQTLYETNSTIPVEVPLSLYEFGSRIVRIRYSTKFPSLHVATVSTRSKVVRTSGTVFIAAEMATTYSSRALYLGRHQQHTQHTYQQQKPYGQFKRPFIVVRTIKNQLKEGIQGMRHAKQRAHDSTEHNHGNTQATIDDCCSYSRVL